MVLVGGSVLAAVTRASAQQSQKAARVGVLFTTTPVEDMVGLDARHPGARQFLRTLHGLGYKQGVNLTYEPRSAAGNFERFTELVQELVNLKMDVIVTIGEPMTLRARAVTQTTPLVMAYSTTPVEAGLVQTLARPGGNVTGMIVSHNPEVEAKRLQLLKEVLPAISRVSFLGMKADWDSALGASVQAAARTLGISLQFVEHRSDSYADAFNRIAADRPDALFFANSPSNFGNRAALAEFATRQKLPATTQAREFVDIGMLMSYGLSVPDLFRKAAVYVAQILAGAKPAEMPVEQPTKFEMVINLRTAKALGLAIPSGILLRADDVVH